MKGLNFLHLSATTTRCLSSKCKSEVLFILLISALLFLVLQANTLPAITLKAKKTYSRFRRPAYTFKAFSFSACNANVHQYRKPKAAPSSKATLFRLILRNIDEQFVHQNQGFSPFYKKSILLSPVFCSLGCEHL